MPHQWDDRTTYADKKASSVPGTGILLEEKAYEETPASARFRLFA